MTNTLIKKDDGFYRSGHDRPIYSYRDIPRHLRFHIPDWSLHTSIGSGEQNYDCEDPWELIQPRDASLLDKLGEGRVLPLEFTNPEKIRVLAELQIEQHRAFEVIDESGCRPFNGKMHLHISEDETGSGNVWHSSPADDGDPDCCEEAIYWNLKLPRVNIEWLRDELTRYSGATLVLELAIAAYQSVGESFGARSWMQQTFALEPDSWTPIVDAEITVVND